MYSVERSQSHAQFAYLSIGYDRLKMIILLLIQQIVYDTFRKETIPISAYDFISYSKLLTYFVEIFPNYFISIWMEKPNSLLPMKEEKLPVIVICRHAKQKRSRKSETPYHYNY